MKKWSAILMVILVAAQFAVPFSRIQSKEKILREGKVFRFLTRPIDPADPFRGRYVQLGYQHDHIPCSDESSIELGYGARMYALIETGEDGFAYFSRWRADKPDDGDYLETRYQGRYRQWNQARNKSEYKGLRIDIPFDRFYMDEAKAPRAEALARNAARTTNCWAKVRILEGKAVIEDVFVDGQSLRVLAAEKE